MHSPSTGEMISPPAPASQMQAVITSELSMELTELAGQAVHAASPRSDFQVFTGHASHAPASAVSITPSQV